MRNRANLISLIKGVLFILLATSASAAGQWDRAVDCFNNQKFKCAFSEAKKLAKDGRVIVGNGRMTTDGMTFYQMAMLEYLVDASVDEIGDAALFTLKVFNKKTRLPYSVEMGFLALMLSTTNQKSAEKFVDTVCRIARESPPPSWRKLQGVNPISSRAYRYFENLKKIKPKCLY